MNAIHEAIKFLRGNGTMFADGANAVANELEALLKQEPVEIVFPDYHHEAMGCGLEDRGIKDRYDAMYYGWECALDRVAECIPENLHEYPRPPCDLKALSEEIKEACIHACDFRAISTSDATVKSESEKCGLLISQVVDAAIINEIITKHTVGKL